MDKGLFLVFEGADGSGKTTALNYTADVLRSKGLKVITTKEPGGTDVAMKIRELVVNEDKVKEPIDPISQLLLFYAARIQNLKRVIIPALKQGHIVLSDRYIDSTYVYQGLLNGLQSTIDQLLMTDTLRYLKERPDHVLFFDVTPEISKNRTVGRGIMNSLDIEYLSKKELPIKYFRNHFNSITADVGLSQTHHVNANEDIAGVYKQINSILETIENKKHELMFVNRI